MHGERTAVFNALSLAENVEPFKKAPMKYLKYTLVAIMAIVVLFLSVGLVKPQITYESETMVGKPVAESWAVIQDEEKLPDWLMGFQRIEHVSGTPGTVGAVSDVYFDNNGQTMSIRETITELVRDEFIAMTYESDFMDMDYRMTMTPVDGQTKISSSTVVKGNGMFTRSMMAFMGSSFTEQEETNLANLKRTIEENTKEYFPVSTPRDTIMQ